VSEKTVSIELPVELWSALEQVARELGYMSPEQAATAGLAEWIMRRKSEIEDRDPSQRYFVNEALDDLEVKKKN